MTKTNMIRKWCAILMMLVMLPFSAFEGGYAESQGMGNEGAETTAYQTDASSDLMPAANLQPGEQETGLSLPPEGFEGREIQEEGDYRYSILSDQTAVLIEYMGTQRSVTVPLSIGGADVSAIEELFS